LRYRWGSGLNNIRAVNGRFGQHGISLSSKIILTEYRIMLMKKIVAKVHQFTDQWLDRAIGAEEPKLYFKQHGFFDELFNSLPQLKRKYKPTPWLANSHLHIFYFDVVKKKNHQIEYDVIEQLTMSDGGVTAIAWVGLDLPENTPTIVILHTLTGSPESMVEMVHDLHQYTGWRIALCVRRGHANLPMTVPKINLFGSPDDLKEQLAHIQQRFPESDLYAVGSSAGTGLLVRYLGDVGKNTPIKAAFALCPGYNTETGFKNVHPFYSKIMVKKLCQRFIEPYSKAWREEETIKVVTRAKNLAEFEKVYYRMAGFHDYESYSKATNPIYVLDNIHVPLLILNAEDDPVCHIKNFEPYKDALQQKSNIAVITTKKGSHCGFYEGTFNTKSWANQLIADFFKIQRN